MIKWCRVLKLDPRIRIPQKTFPLKPLLISNLNRTSSEHWPTAHTWLNDGCLQLERITEDIKFLVKWTDYLENEGAQLSIEFVVGPRGAFLYLSLPSNYPHSPALDQCFPETWFCHWIWVYFDWPNASGFQVFTLFKEESERSRRMDNLLVHGGALVWMSRSFCTFCELLAKVPEESLRCRHNFQTSLRRVFEGFHDSYIC